MSVPRDHAEFSIAMLAALRRYKRKLARSILHECQEDLRIDGWDAVKSRWGPFIEAEAVTDGYQTDILQTREGGHHASAE